MTDEANQTKVALLIEPRGGFHNYELGPRPVPVKRSLPWYRTTYRRTGSVAYLHRVRSATFYPWRGFMAHVCFRLWCGRDGQGSNGELFAEIPENAVVCATCEARAVGAGWPPLAITVVKPIKFRPQARWSPEWTMRDES